MKHFIYLIISYHNNRFTSYVGYTKNIKNRLKLHNSSKGAKFTRGRSWKIIYKKGYNIENVVNRSKAVGEPPFMLALSVFSAIKDAVFNANNKDSTNLIAPATAENILNSLN